MKKLIYLFSFLFLSSIVFAQFEHVESFPYHSTQSLSVIRSFLFDAGNGNLLFFFGESSVYLSRSENNGVSWQDPTLICDCYTSENIDVKKIGNEIFLLLPAQKIFVSSDNGATWEGPFQLPRPRSKYLYLENNGSQYFVFIDYNPIVYYTSSDGKTWDATQHSFVPPYFKSFSFVKFEEGNYKMAVAYQDINDNLYKIKIAENSSLDDNWTSNGDIYIAPQNKKISVVRSVKTYDGKIWILFTLDNYTDHGENYDIYYITSEDGGSTWTQPELFAKSYSDDILRSVSPSGNFPLVSFISGRLAPDPIPIKSERNSKSGNPIKNGTKDFTDIFYGKAGLSTDVFFPPFVSIDSKDFVTNFNSNSISFYVNAKVYSWNQLASVQLVKNNEVFTLYDDGNHGDGVAGDSIFGTGSISGNLSGSSVQFALVVTDNYSNTKTFEFLNQQFNEILSNSLAVINNGDVNFPISNNGIIGNYPHKVNYDLRSVIYSAGFYLSGYNNGELWINGMFPSNLIIDYLPGSCGDEGNGKIYYVKTSDPPFGESWQLWAEAVQKGARFYDGNGDGIYNPVDLNGNGVWDENEDAPEMQGTITAWCVYNDGVPSQDRQFTNVSPLGIEIRQTVWTRKYDPEFKNVFFVRYSIFNTGTVSDELDSVYFSVATDADIGNYANDFVGSNPDLLTGYTYDNQFDLDYGINSPTVMTTYLDIRKTPSNDLPDIAEMNNSFYRILISSGCDIYSCRNFMLGLDPNGNVINPCEWPEGAVFGGIDCSTIDGRWMYSGNPVDSIGWINTYSYDQRGMLNTGPFTIHSGESVDITVAYHFSRGQTSLQSVTLGLDNAQYLRDNAFVLGTEEYAQNKPVKFNLSQNYPNPFNPTTIIEYSIPNLEAKNLSLQQNVQLKIFDVLGREIATLVNKKQLPGNYSVRFDASTLPSGVYFYTLRAGEFVATKKMVLMK